MEEVIDGVWIGDLHDGLFNMEEVAEFDRVISLCTCAEQYRDEITTDYCPIEDGACDYGEFATAVDLTVDAIENDETVFVHCASGISRSAAVLSTALAATGKADDFEHGLELVKDARSHVNPLSPLKDRGRYYLNVDGDERQAVSFAAWIESR